MTNDKLRKAVIKRLGIEGSFPMSQLVRLVQAQKGNLRQSHQTYYDYLHLFMFGPSVYTEPRVTWEFKPYRPKPHPRAAEIDAAQPPMYTPTGIVNNMSFGDFFRA